MNEAQVIATHQAAGRFFKAGSVGSFVLEEGEGEPVVCMHGVPASSFLFLQKDCALEVADLVADFVARDGSGAV